LNSAKVSRYHARIEFNGSGFEVIDTQSTNKVNLNGMNVDRAVLKSGDRIILGDVIVTFI
jgi:pSer/pThr/pTyr-binding forkhead associated (FHA) protein